LDSFAARQSAVFPLFALLGHRVGDTAVRVQPLQRVKRGQQALTLSLALGQGGSFGLLLGWLGAQNQHPELRVGQLWVLVREADNAVASNSAA